MAYPLISEYVEAIKASEDNFEELSYLRPVLDDNGQPIMTSGNFAVVFKMKDEQSGKFYAVKCFTKEQEGRAEAYREIAKELKDVSSPYLVSIRYLEKELFVDTDQTIETEFPVLLMDWVEGKTLDKYLRENLDDKYALEMLAYRFSQLAQWLIPQPFAHGDLKPDNILVREDGSLVLVDYDGMYVPAMKGQKARELGSPDFRHPLRTEDDFDEHIDNFPLVSVLLSLIAMSIRPSFLEEYGTADRLLLSKEDYNDYLQSQFLTTIDHMGEVNGLSYIYAIFSHLVRNSYLNSHESVKKILFVLENNIPKPLKYSYPGKENIDSQIICSDRYGVKYSRDGKLLIEGCDLAWNSYIIPDGTEIICDEAFNIYGDSHDDWDGGEWNEGDKIIIPASVREIGVNPFAKCNVRLECNSPYFYTKDCALYSKDGKILISYYGFKSIVHIPEGVEVIGNRAFYGQYEIEEISLPSSLVTIGDYAFAACTFESITIPDGVKYIGNGAFYRCDKIKDLILPNSIISIGNYAFSRCDSLFSIVIPQNVVNIGYNPFYNWNINNKLSVTCNSPLYETDGKSLYSKGKRYLISCYAKDRFFKYHKETTHIGKRAFVGCPIHQLVISDDIEFISEDTFDGCIWEDEYGWSSYRLELVVSPRKATWLRAIVDDKVNIKE